MQLISATDPTDTSRQEVSSDYNLHSFRSDSDEIHLNLITMKELPTGDNLCIPIKENHLQNNGQFKLNSVEVETSDIANLDGETDITNKNKVMIGNVDISSTSQKINTSWGSSSSLLDSYNDKDSLISSNGVLYDQVSDDESIMLHLSDDELDKSPVKTKTDEDLAEDSLKNGICDEENEKKNISDPIDSEGTPSCFKSPVKPTHLLQEKDSIQEENPDAVEGNGESPSSEAELAALVGDDKNITVSSNGSNTLVGNEGKKMIPTVYDDAKVCTTDANSIELHSLEETIDISNKVNKLNCQEFVLDSDLNKDSSNVMELTGFDTKDTVYLETNDDGISQSLNCSSIESNSQSQAVEKECGALQLNEECIKEDDISLSPLKAEYMQEDDIILPLNVECIQEDIISLALNADCIQEDISSLPLNADCIKDDDDDVSRLSLNAECINEEDISMPLNADFLKENDDCRLPLNADCLKKDDDRLPLNADCLKEDNDGTLPLNTDCLEEESNSGLPLNADCLKEDDDSRLPLNTDCLKEEANSRLPLNADCLKEDDDSSLSLNADCLKEDDDSRLPLNADCSKEEANSRLPLNADSLKEDDSRLTLNEDYMKGEDDSRLSSNTDCMKNDDSRLTLTADCAEEEDDDEDYDEKDNSSLPLKTDESPVQETSMLKDVDFNIKEKSLFKMDDSDASSDLSLDAGIQMKKNLHFESECNAKRDVEETGLLKIDSDENRIDQSSLTNENLEEGVSKSLQSEESCGVEGLENQTEPFRVDSPLVLDCDNTRLDKDTNEKLSISLCNVDSNEKEIVSPLKSNDLDEDDHSKKESVSTPLQSNNLGDKNGCLHSESEETNNILLNPVNSILKSCNNIDSENNCSRLKISLLKNSESACKDIDGSQLQTDNCEEKSISTHSDSNCSTLLDLLNTSIDDGNSATLVSEENKKETSEVADKRDSGIKNSSETNITEDNCRENTEKNGSDDTHSAKSSCSDIISKQTVINTEECNLLNDTQDEFSDVESESLDLNQVDENLLLEIGDDPCEIETEDNILEEDNDKASSNDSHEQGLVTNELELKDKSDQNVISGKETVCLTTGGGDPGEGSKPGVEEERSRLKRSSVTEAEDKTNEAKRTKLSKNNSSDSVVGDESEKESVRKDATDKEVRDVTGINVVAPTKLISTSISKRPLEGKTGFIEVKKVRIMPEVERQRKDAAKKNVISVNDSGNVGDSGNVSDKSASSDQPEASTPRKELLTNLDEAIERVVAAAVAESAPVTRKLNPMPFMRKLNQSQLKKLTRNDLEELVVQKLCEVVTERCQVGELRQKVQMLETMLEQWRKKAMQLSKQVKDMEMVVRKFTTDQRQKKDRLVIPVKITRSVGLQVSLGQLAPLSSIKNRVGSEGIRDGSPVVRRRISKSIVPMVPPSLQSQAPRVQTQSPVAVQKVVPPPGYPKTVTTSNNMIATSSPSIAVRQSSAIYANMQPTAVKTSQASIKTIPSRSPITTSIVSTPTSVANMSNLRLAAPAVANRTIRPAVSHPPNVNVTNAITVKSAQDLKVIDLTDEEDRTKSNLVRNTAPGSTMLTATTPSVVPASATLLPSPNIGGRGIRVVQPHQLSGATTALLTPTSTNSASTQRVAYLVPSSVGAGQQRQLLIATSTSQVRPGGVMTGSIMSGGMMSGNIMSGGMMSGGVMSMANRPAIVFKSGGTVLQGAAITGGPLQQMIGAPRPGQQIRVAPNMFPVNRLTPVTNLAPVPTLAPPPPQPQPNSIHPAPLPSSQPFAGPTGTNWKMTPPKPELKISKVVNKNQQGIVLSWNMHVGSEHEDIASYQLFAYQEGNAAPSTSLWKKVGDVKALPLPMACTLTQFMEGHKYHFAVRAMDIHMRHGPFSAPGNIVLTRK